MTNTPRANYRPILVDAARAGQHGPPMGRPGYLFLTGGMVYINHLHERNSVLIHERDAAIADKAAADKDVLGLAVERAAANMRNKVVSGAQADILQTEDYEIAPALWIGLRTADKIGRM